METNRTALNSTLYRLKVGNQVPRYSGWKPTSAKYISACFLWLETKYRDIADGNSSTNPGREGIIPSLETKYRDIADGNFQKPYQETISWPPVGNQVPRYSGWKLYCRCWYRQQNDGVGNQVPRYSGWKP